MKLLYQSYSDQLEQFVKDGVNLEKYEKDEFILDGDYEEHKM